jgi:CHAT domain-containing protein
LKTRQQIVCHNSDEWKITRAVAARTARRGAAAPIDWKIPPEFLAPRRVIIEQTIVAEARVDGVRRGLAPQVVDLSVATARGEGCVLLARHQSGALTFHAPEHTELRRGAAGSGVARFRISVPSAQVEQEGRRGPLGMIAKKIVKITVLKIIDKLVDLALPVLARKWEEQTWKRQGLTEGWFRLDRALLRSAKLPAWKPDASLMQSGHSLLFLHGTFSHAASAYRHLADGGFFEHVAPIYGERIFAFNHFTVSRTPRENAQMLVDALPSGRFQFDVVTHSRGGLVLRNLVEQNVALGGNGKRFELGHAVLVASPNEGTPLATPVRWEKTVGWVANILEMFPDNPFTIAAEWIAESIVWLGRHASGGLPGIGSMDGRGDAIATLQGPPAPEPNAYSALVANYSPEPDVWARLLDVGIDGFFGIANDLVVPTEGGWRIDKGPESYVPADRIGCFGAGGNLTARAVHHLNFFGQPETANFLADALERKPQGLSPVDSSRLLPNRRGMGALPPARAAAIRTVKQATAESQPLPEPTESKPKITAAPVFTISEPDDTFYLTILDPALMQMKRAMAARKAKNRSEKLPPDFAQLLANYGSARVVVPFKRHQAKAGRRFRNLIAMQRRLRDYIDGKPGTNLPSDRELIRFGTLLFDTLFPSEVRRLYDVARSLRGGERLDFIFTSMIPWVADLPWEFAYDKERGAFLATQEIHFVRNVLTSIPAEEISEHPPPLRVLVVGAQPIGQAELSIEEEATVIRRGFEPLIDAGFLDLVVLPQATPQVFHSAIATGRFDIVHFIGHAEFGSDNTGHLLFEDSSGAAQAVGARSLREIFGQRGIRLVFLNACETGRDSYKNANVGAAPSLVAAGIPAVVANQFKVLDKSATNFAQFFYWSLAQGMSIGRAAREARIALNYSISGETIDWAVPVLYARNPRARLCPRTDTAIVGHPKTMPTIAPSRRSAVQDHHKRIGVWDVATAFPHLDGTLARLNAAQTQFGFESVDLSAPIGTWQFTSPRSRATSRPEGVPYLHADEVARRLQHKPYELKLDGLICITNERMSGPDSKGRQIKDIYVWWDEPKRPIMLFSTAGFELPPRGPLVDKVLANAIALCLVGQFAQVQEAHARDPKSCILFYNPERLFEVVAGQRDIEPRCRAILEREIPDDLPAIEQLLRVFPVPKLKTVANAKYLKRQAAGSNRRSKRLATRQRRPR